MVGQQLPPQIYPLGQPPDGPDARFTVGLIVAVADVLADHGFPNIVRTGSGRDFAELRQVLFKFVFGPDYTSDVHAETCAVWHSPTCDCAGGAQ